MSSQKLGPFRTKGAARAGLVERLRDGVDAESSIGKMFVDQYVGLLAELALHPNSDAVTYKSIRWSLYKVENPRKF